MGERTSALVNPMKIGKVADGDYTEYETDGTPVQHGSATAWDDLVGSLIASRLDSVAGKLQYNYAENAITMQSGGDIDTQNDRLIFNYQKPHGAKADSKMMLHIHWEQIDATDREFTVEYRIQDNGQAKNTTWVRTVITADATSNVFLYTSGTINQITRLVDVDLASHGISTTVQFRLARTDSIGGNIDATFVDTHVEYDMNGSRTEFTK